MKPQIWGFSIAKLVIFLHICSGSVLRVAEGNGEMGGGAQDMTEKTSEAMTIGEAADLIRVSRRHFHKLMADGAGPPVIQLGRRKIIRREALLQWLVGRETTPVSG